MKTILTLITATFALAAIGLGTSQSASAETLRVGMECTYAPFNYRTADGALTGYDVDVAKGVGKLINADLEFVCQKWSGMIPALLANKFDLVVASMSITDKRKLKMDFSVPYRISVGRLVGPKNAGYDLFDNSGMAQPANFAGLKVGLERSSTYATWFAAKLPDANIVFLAGAEDFFNGGGQGADALLLSAEEGAAYSYRYPRYAVVKAENGGIRLPAGYAVPKGDIEMMEFVSNWVDLKQKEGTVDQLYEYWMLGGVAKPRQPRWSIVRDVLGWVD